MPTSNAFQLIEKKTLASASTGVTFSSIPGTFTHLVFSISFPPSGSNAYVSKAYFNNDTNSANYTCQRIFESGGSVSADRITNSWLTGGWTVGGNVVAYDTLITMYFFIPNYTNTNFYRTAVIRVADNDGGYHGAISAVYQSAQAITRFDYEMGTNQLPIGTVASLYGVL